MKLYNKFEQPMTVRLILLLAIMFTLVLPVLSNSLTVQAKTGTINQNSIYFFLISDASWTNAGTVQLVFQSPPYSFTNTTGITSCYEPNTLTTFNCYASNASTIAFNWDPSMMGGTTTTVFYLQLMLINPPYVDNFTVIYNFLYPTTSSVYSTLTGKVSGLSSDSLTACSLAFTPSYTNSLSVVTVSFTTKNSIPSGGSLQLVINNYVTSDSIPTVNVLNNSSILNSSVVGSSTGQNYFFSKLFSNNVAAGSIVSFSLSSLTTPPTTQTSYFSYYIATTYTNFYLNTIDSSTCAINTIIDYPIANLITVLTSVLYVGNTMQTVRFDFTSPTLMNFTTDTITVTTDSSSLNYLTINTLTAGFATTNRTGSLSARNITNGMQITTTTGQTIVANTGVAIQSGIRIKSIMNSGVKNIFVQFLRSGYSYASATCTIIIAPNALYTATISSLSQIVSQLTTYTFTIQIRNPLGLGAGITIKLPNDLWIATGACTIVSLTSSLGGSLSSSPTCTASSNTVINVGNITSSAMTGNVTITVAISNIQNPISIKPTLAVLIQTLYSASELINPVDDSTTLTGLTVTATSLIINTGSFSISRNISANLKYAIYTVSYTVNSRFKANGYITLTLPATVTLSSSPTVTYTLNTNGSVSASQTLPTTSTLTNGSTIITFNFSNLITTDLSSGVIFTIIVNSIQNYPSFKPINPQISTYTNDNFLIEYSAATAFTLTNSVEDTSLTVASTTSSRINGKSTTCTFQLTSPAPMVAGNLITVELQLTNNVNTQMYLNSSSLACQIGGVTAICSVDTVNTYMVKITTAAISANTAVIVSVSGIILSRSFDQPGSIYFRLFEVSGGTNYPMTSATLVPPVNTNTNLVITTSLSINDGGGTYPSQLNQIQLFSITFTSTNRLHPGDIVVITIPSQYQFVLSSTVGNSTFTTGSLCTAFSTLYCSNNNSSPNQIRIVEKTNGNVFTNITSLTVTINNNTYRSPQLWTTYNTNPFIVNTYSINGQAVDSVQSGTTTNATFYLTCANSSAHCKTCTGGLCNSCYQVGDGNDTSFGYGGYYYLTSTKECVTACGTNFFNQSNVCVQCTSPCLSCSGPATFCTSCVNSTFKLYNNSCLTGCPNSYYADSSNVCQACNNNCFSCSLTPTNCTACNGNYLSSVTSSCVVASGCASTTYPDSSTFICTDCSVSCVQCTINSTMCKVSCSTGFIINTAFNTNNSFPAQCTDQCPSGTVNDTNNSLGQGIGCRCNTSVCITCTGTINSCLTCKTGLVLLNTTCLSSCGSGYYVSNGTCYSCPSGCSSCSSSTICTGCSATGYWIYQGFCVNTCPSFTSYAVSGGSQTCITCSSGCTACQTTTYCTTCLSPNYIEGSDVNTQYCTSTCSTGKNVMGSRCSATCDSGYTAVNGVCQANLTNTATAITTTLTSSSSRLIPFPVTIALAVLSITALASKVALPYTIVPAVLASFSGAMQVLSWFVFIIAVSVDASASEYPTAKIGLYIVLVALVVTWLLNAISLYFFKKYIWPDDKFQTNFKRLRNKTKTGVCVTYTCLVITALFSHKFVEILFSNLFEAGYFLYKVQDKVKFTPLNYIRYVSLSASILALVGAAIANFQYQSLSIGNLVFIQSIDLLIVTILAGIACLWATVRKSEDYENSIALKHDIEQELDHDPVGDDGYHEQDEMKGGNTRSKYIHKSSHRNNTIDPKENPIPKKGSTLVGPTGEDFNITNAALDGKDEFDLDKINLQDMSDVNFKNRKGSGLDLDDIAFEESMGDDLLPTKHKGKKGASPHNNKGKPTSNRYTKNEGAREEAIDDEKAKQKLKLKNNIEKTLTNEEIEKTKVIKDVDKINTTILQPDTDIQPIPGSENYIKDKDKNQLKQKQLSTLSGAQQQDLKKLPNNEREKAGQIKTAMSLLEAKKINIREYLQYLDIIEQQEDENVNSDDYEQKPKRHLKGNKNNKNKLSKSKNKPKPDRTARKVDADLVISHGYDEEIQPEIPDINLASVRARKHAESADNSDDDNYNHSHTRKHNKNKSDKYFMKNKLLLDDLVLVSLESGENYDRSLGEEFQRGNALHPVDKDELPPSNMYATEKMQEHRKNINNSNSIGKNRMVPNPLIGNGDHIDFLQSDGADEETIKNDVQFHQDISPSQFNQPNLRISNDEVSEAPTKPKLFKKDRQARISNDGKVLQVQDIEDMQQGQPDEFNHDEFNNVYEGDIPAGTKMNRYNSSRMLDYDQILYNKRQNQKMKRLQQIYLPRLDVHKTNNSKRKRNNYSTNSERRKDEK